MSPRFGVLPIFPAQEIKRNEALIRCISYFSCTGNQENLEHDTVNLCAWFWRLTGPLEWLPMGFWRHKTNVEGNGHWWHHLAIGTERDFHMTFGRAECCALSDGRVDE